MSNGHEYAELLSEILGELNVSHSGAATRRAENATRRRRSIFYDYAHTGAGVKVVEVMEGRSTAPG